MTVLTYEERMARKRQAEEELYQAAQGQPPLHLQWVAGDLPGRKITWVSARMGNHSERWLIVIQPRPRNLGGWTGYIEHFNDFGRTFGEVPNRRNTMVDEAAAKAWALRRLRAARAGNWIITPISPEEAQEPDPMSRSNLRQQFIDGAAEALAADPGADPRTVVEQYAAAQGLRRATWAGWSEEMRGRVVVAVGVKALHLQSLQSGEADQA